MDPLYSVVICTYNRSSLLNISIPSVLSQPTDSFDFELIIVDNGSSDSTKHIVSIWQKRSARVRYIHEPKRGLSVARNRGVEEASGQFVIYIDDDAEPINGWLTAIHSGFCHSTNPVAVCGPVFLRWPKKKPYWVSQKHETLFTCLDHGASPFLFSKPEHFMVGANMAFSKGALIEIGGFDENLGRIGDNLLSGEDSEIIERIKEKGLRIFYSPKAAVLHHVTSERLSLKWYSKRVFMDGFSQKIIAKRNQINTKKSHFLTFEFKILVYYILKFGFSVLIFKRENTKYYFGEILQRFGRLYSTYKNY